MVNFSLRLFSLPCLPVLVASAGYALLVALGCPRPWAAVLMAVWGLYLLFIGAASVELFLKDQGAKPTAKDAVRFGARLTLRMAGPFVLGSALYLLFPRFLAAPAASVRAPLFPELHGNLLTLETWTALRRLSSVLAGVIPECFLLVILLAVTGRKKDETKVPARGRTLWPLHLAQRVADEIRPREDPGIPFGGCNLETDVETLHMAVLGTTGSGKSMTLRLSMQASFAPIGQGRNVRGIAYDAKGDLIPYLVGMGVRPERIINMHVLHRDGVAWDMCQDVRDDVTVAAVAEILFPPNPNAKEPFFDDAARALMEGVMNVFVERTPDSWQFADVIYAMRNQKRLVEVLKLTPEGRELVELYFSKESTALDVMATVANKTKPYRIVAGAWAHAKEKMSLTKFFQGEYLLVLGNSHTAKPTVRAVNQVLFVRLVQLILEQPNDGTQRMPVFIDELKTARFDVESLLLLADEGRSRGVSLYIGFQDLSGLQGVYGEKETDDLLGMCNRIAILRLASPKTAEWACSLIGKYEGFEVSTGFSVDKDGNRTNQVHQNRVTGDTVLGSQFLDLPRCSKRNGLWGYYIAPDVGAWWGRLSGDYLAANLRPPDKSIPALIKRPKTELTLPPWNAEDCYRLGLDPGLVPDPSDLKPDTGNVVELEPRRRMKASALKRRRGDDRKRSAS